MEKLNNNVFMDFREFVCWVGMGMIKSDQKIKIWLKSDKNNRHFTYRLLYIHDYSAVYHYHGCLYY